jgi:3-oxoadipate enol-lactonase
LDHFSIASAHFCGLSMGGPTGIWAALHHPTRINRLILSNTAARIGSAEGWSSRIAAVKKNTLETMVPALVERWLTEQTRHTEPGLTQILVDMLRRTPDEGYMGSCAALRDADVREQVADIKAPTLIISGAHDLAATPADGHYLNSAIAGSRYVELDTSHIANWKQADAYSRIVRDFLLE